MPKTLKKILAVVALVLFLVVNFMSYEDEVNEGRNYCKMVAEGTWPNWKKKDCSDE